MASIQNFYFLVYSTIAVGLIMLSAISALTSRDRLGRPHLIATTITCVLAVPVTGAAALGAAPGFAPLQMASVALPVVCALAIWCNRQSVRGLGVGFEVMQVPILLWNALLFVAYAIRATHLLLHYEFGDAGAGILAALSVVQQNIGDVDSELTPLYLYLPLLLPPVAGSRGFSLASKMVAGFVASFLVAVFIMALPQGFAMSLTQRKPPRPYELAPRGDIRVSMQLPDFGLQEPPAIPDLGWISNTASLAEQVGRARELGLDRVELVVDAGVTDDDKRMKRLGQVVDYIRENKLGVVLITAEPARLRRRFAVEPEKFIKAMEIAHWLFAERFHPDLLVLYRRPLDPKLEARLGHPPVAKWVEMIQGSIKALRIGKPDQKLAVDLSITSENARELYVALGKSELREIRLLVAGNRMGRQTLVRNLMTVGSWMTVHPTTKQIGIVAAPPSPLGFCGFDAQQFYVERLIAFANQQPLIASVCLGPVTDQAGSWNGYWDASDRPRPVLGRVRELLKIQRPARSKPPR